MEKDIERRFTKAVKSVGGIALKFVSPGFNGMPDRLVLMPVGKIGFVEVKDKGKKPRALQKATHRKLSMLGFKVYILDRPEQIEKIIKEIGGDDL